MLREIRLFQILCHKEVLTVHPLQGGHTGHTANTSNKARILFPKLLILPIFYQLLGTCRSQDQF